LSHLTIASRTSCDQPGANENEAKERGQEVAADWDQAVFDIQQRNQALYPAEVVVLLSRHDLAPVLVQPTLWEHPPVEPVELFDDS